MLTANSRNTNSVGSDIRGTGGKSKPSSLFGLPRRQRASEDRGDRGNQDKQKRKFRSELSRTVKKYVRMATSLLYFRRRDRGEDIELEVQRFAPGDLRGTYMFSAPASIATSPRNSGLVKRPVLSDTVADSTVEELQAAIQAAIAYCKKSIADEVKEEKEEDKLQTWLLNSGFEGQTKDCHSNWTKQLSYVSFFFVFSSFWLARFHFHQLYTYMASDFMEISSCRLQVFPINLQCTAFMESPVETLWIYTTWTLVRCTCLYRRAHLVRLPNIPLQPEMASPFDTHSSMHYQVCEPPLRSETKLFTGFIPSQLLIPNISLYFSIEDISNYFISGWARETNFTLDNP